MNLTFAPGARIEVRDAERVVRRVDRSPPAVCHARGKPASAGTSGAHAGVCIEGPRSTRRESKVEAFLKEIECDEQPYSRFTDEAGALLLVRRFEAAHRPGFKQTLQGIEKGAAPSPKV